KPPVPAKEAVSVWAPTPSATVSFAWPSAFTWAVPSTELPSRKVTLPVGTPPCEVTVAVSVSACPTTAVVSDDCSAVLVGPPCAGGGEHGRSNRPIWLPPSWVNQMLPSGPVVISPGALPAGKAPENSVTTPAVVIRPSWPRPTSENHRFPSGAATICAG